MKAPEESVGGNWWGEEGENILAKLEEGQDFMVDRLVRKTFPPTFKLIMLLLPDIVSSNLLELCKERYSINT